MLFKCGSSDPAYQDALTDITPIRRQRGSAGQLHIDVHCHVVSEKAAKLAGTPPRPKDDPFVFFSSQDTKAVSASHAKITAPKMSSLEQRLADMDYMGVDIQVVSTSPFQYFHWTEPELGAELARIVNDNIADMAAHESGRIVGVGTLPMQDPLASQGELERCIQLGFKGIQFSTNINGEELASEKFHKLYRRMEEAQMVMFLHPNGYTDGARLSKHYLNNLIGNPLDTTVAVAHLIFDGVLDKVPGLNICLPHAGGYLGAYPGRFDHAYCARPDCRRHASKLPREYLKKMFFDTIAFDRGQLEALVEQWGPDHVVLGTDYPYDMGDDDPVGAIDQLRITEEEKIKIRGANAAALLRLRAPKD
ncbi:amidohydrolase family protein [Candidimonas nitroreducens]|uniref:Aminocarboxymuconate-semialdehyde decarboxylase n=1 Tax=Candidimonas nitroreducens TaxID=683354 RepID=A0A225MFQ1_9BURK|nr:amidohydrolase family protein [Candidimonas nitroreducens]OWT60137.1 aminocarboxymuconate-semialdehyde decarboxylase [Candidimonas nitroreducens]